MTWSRPRFVWPVLTRSRMAAFEVITEAPTVGLLNMNGRVYDPVVGRFLSPDPNVQSPNDLQSYNRYSYVFNNPLRYTDPTGYFSVSGALPGILIGLVTIGACVAVPGVGCVVATVITTLANVELARGEGASWGQIALTTGIGLAAGTLGGAAGGFLGGALGAAPGSRLAQRRRHGQTTRHRKRVL